jgi:hypothetical protein
MRRGAALKSIIATFAMILVACSNGAAPTALRQSTLSPSPSPGPTLTLQTPSPALTSACARQPVRVRYVFEKGISQSSRDFIRKAIGLAQRFLPVRPILLPSGNDCVADTVTVRAHRGLAGTEWEGGTGNGDGIGLYDIRSDWDIITIAIARYELLFHEWYHVYQAHRMSDPMFEAFDVAWLIEGSATLAEYATASHYGLLDFDAQMRDSILATEERQNVPLKPLEQRATFLNTRPTPPYALVTVAVQFLVGKRGGLRALDKFWDLLKTGCNTGDCPWASAFKQAFGQTPGKFYREFDAYRANGFAS